MKVPANAATTVSLIRKLAARDVLGDDEVRIIDRMFNLVELVKAGEDIVREGERPRSSTLLVSGVAARYTMLNGGARQITALHLLGDFVDLHSFLLKEMDHGVVAITPCRVARVPHETLAEISVTQPHLTRLFWFLTLLDSALHREWLVGMGRRSAIGRLAHLLCEIKVRLEVVGACNGLQFVMPLTQTDLSDVLGLSTVHVNRVLQELRGEKLLSWKGPNVSILDWEELQRRAEFDDRYLHLTREPR